MKTNNYFPKQQSKLKFEAILKSVLCGLAVGFGANFIAALATWFTPFNGLWLSLGVLVGVTLIASAIFYFKRFRPTDLTNARRIDSLGLDERLVTMVEYSNDNSYIANIQRNDAHAALAKVDTKQLKIKISTAIIVSLIICAVFGAAMTTVNALSEQGLMPGGDELINNFVEEQAKEYVTITYEVEEGGIIEGDEAQIIEKGTDATTVTAVADDGFMFKEWSDGSTDPTRTDVAVTEDVVYTAVFVEVDDGDGDGDGEGEGDGDEPGDQPGEPGKEGDNGNNAPSDPGTPQQGANASGAAKPNNQIIDGETFYREVIETYKDSANEQIDNKDSGLSDAEKELIKKYLDIV